MVFVATRISDVFSFIICKAGMSIYLPANYLLIFFFYIEHQARIVMIIKSMFAKWLPQYLEKRRSEINGEHQYDCSVFFSE